MSTDAIVLLKNEHKEIRKAFRAFEDAGDRAEARKGQLVDRIIELLTIHTYIENEVMYPQVRELLPDARGRRPGVLRGAPRRRRPGDGAATMKPSDERFDAKTTVLIENVEHHMAEEEQDWFPKVREGLGRKQLQEIGAEMIARARRPLVGPASRAR